MGCIGASDDHGLTNGMTDERIPGLGRYPGITGVLAKENTPEAIFDALKARRCFWPAPRPACAPLPWRAGGI